MSQSVWEPERSLPPPEPEPQEAAASLFVPCREKRASDETK